MALETMVDETGDVELDPYTGKDGVAKTVYAFRCAATVQGWGD